MSQSILIIGAGPGIGQAAAERFGREGWTVILSRRDAQALAAQVRELVAQGIDAHGLPADATDPRAVRELVAAAVRIAGALDVVSYNAATIRLQDLFSMTDAEVEDDLAINIAGGLHTIRSLAGELGDDRGECVCGIGAEDEVGEPDLLTSSLDLLGGGGWVAREDGQRIHFPQQFRVRVGRCHERRDQFADHRHMQGELDVAHRPKVVGQFGHDGP